MSSRMNFASLGLSASIATILMAGAASAQALPDLSGQTMVFAGFGGDLQSNQEAAWLTPFAEGTGVVINQTDAPDLATISTQQEAGNVQIDVLQIESGTVDAACGTVFAPVEIDRAEIDPALDTNYCGVPVVKFSYVLAYDSSKYAEAPKSVADFFNTEEFPGIRAARGGGPNAGLLETALLADGVEVQAIYPIDFDRALARLETALDSIEIKDNFAVIQDGLANGEFDMALLPNARAYNAFLANPDIKVVFDGAVTLYDNVVVPVGAPNMEAATAFLQYTALNATQVALSERFPYGTGTVGTPPAVDAAVLAFSPDGHVGKLLLQDAAWWGQNEALANDRLSAVLAQ